MVEQLFGSKTRVKLLYLFYGNPNRSFYVREITRKIDEQINSVRRELANLLNIGIIVSDTNNNRLYYEVNQKYDFYSPLVAIFGGGVQAAASVPVVDNKDNKENIEDVKAPVAIVVTEDDVKMKALGHVEIVFYTGQFTRDESSGVDMLIVGDVNKNALQKYIAELETKEGKEIRYVLMPMSEFEYRRQIKDRFITTALDSKKQVLVDKIGLF
jgi:hypothetical protein